MPGKKVRHQFDDAKEGSELPSEVTEVLQLLQQKVLASPVLNGGFDTMMVKVEQIEENQKQMGTKVDSIHEAIYHPDEGLFARVKDVELVKEKAAAVDKLEKDLTYIQHLREREQTHAREASELSKENDKAVKDLNLKVKELSEFKTRVCAIAKWGLVTLGGGAATLVGKLIYDFVSGHITFH